MIDQTTQIVKRETEQGEIKMEDVPRKIVKRDGGGDFYIMGLKIYIFTQTKEYSKLNKFLTDIAEPVSRPAHINQFEVNRSSLLRAKALGKKYNHIVDFLELHMKNKQLSSEMKKMVRSVMQSEDTTRLYLTETQDSNYYILETNQRQFHRLPEPVKHCLQGEPLISNEDEEEEEKTDPDLVRMKVLPYRHDQLASILFKRQVPVLSQKILTTKELSHSMKRYADVYRQNKGVLHCKNLKIGLKAFTKLREYQNESLHSVVQQQKGAKGQLVKSGYIVLPCGAGKTLLGISICAKIKKETLVVCNSDSGADQWKREFEKWTEGLQSEQIVILTAKTIQEFKFNVRDSKPKVFISTYSNLKTKLEGHERQDGMSEVRVEHEWMRLMPWGLVIFDEAQWLPAKGNSLIAKYLFAHVKIGLTATPFREDKEIENLNYMIGPQLYVGSWRKFVDYGYLANPKCMEIRTKLSHDFKQIYRGITGHSIRAAKERQALYECNPNKIKTLMYLLQFHQNLNDQIIVFCDRISIIEYLAVTLRIPLLSGNTSIEDRNFVFDMFREGHFKTLLLSRIGDEAIDLPNANVAIEINMHRGSRRQMLQRLGRIMRPKEASSSESYNAIFYTVVTEDTNEMTYFAKRRECLVNLGFQYDLRFCEYGESRVADILRDDPANAALINEKMREIMPDEGKYWEDMRRE